MPVSASHLFLSRGGSKIFLKSWFPEYSTRFLLLIRFFNRTRSIKIPSISSFFDLCSGHNEAIAFLQLSIWFQAAHWESHYVWGKIFSCRIGFCFLLDWSLSTNKDWCLVHLHPPFFHSPTLWKIDPCWWPTDTSLTTWVGAWVNSAGSREVSRRMEVAKQWASAVVCSTVNGAESALCLAWKHIAKADKRQRSGDVEA